MESSAKLQHPEMVISDGRWHTKKGRSILKKTHWMWGFGNGSNEDAQDENTTTIVKLNSYLDKEACSNQERSTSRHWQTAIIRLKKGSETKQPRTDGTHGFRRKKGSIRLLHKSYQESLVIIQTDNIQPRTATPLRYELHHRAREYVAY
eukprot:1298908-Amorphochlora_amoeboformis.AAC.2